MKCQRCDKEKANKVIIENTELALCYSCVIDVHLSIMGLSPQDDEKIKSLKKYWE